MENQHEHIKGYRDLNEAEIAAMNKIKEIGVALGAIVDETSQIENVDQRWVSIGRSQLQQGLMALTRSVAQPTTF